MKSIEEIKADYNLFLDIQINKYLTNLNRTEFENIDEANLILKKIADAYDNKIASDHLRLNNLNKDAKINWFNSVHIDFTAPDNDLLFEPEDFTEEEMLRINDYFYERFPFLPEGSSAVLLFVGPALEAYGLPFERFQELMLGDDYCTEIEEDILTWAFELTLLVMGSVFERSKKKRENFYKEAVLIAEEELARKDAIKVVNEIASGIKNMQKEFDRFEQGNKKKKK